MLHHFTMNFSSGWLVWALMISVSVSRASCVKLVILRDEAESSSPEDDGLDEDLSGEGSQEMDWLMDLIGKDTSLVESSSKPDKNLSPSATKVLEQATRIETEQIAHHSHPHEIRMLKDNERREYHVHYHNHKHLSDKVKSQGLAEDTLQPIVWDGLDGASQLDDLESIFGRALPKEAIPFLESEHFEDFKDFGTLNEESKPRVATRYNLNADRFRNFKDFESLEETEPKSREPSRYNLNSERFKNFKDFETLLDTQTKPPHNDRFHNFKDFDTLADVESPLDKGRSVGGRFKKIKDFESFLDETPEIPRRPQSGHYGSNAGRFKNFKDFETLLNSPPKITPSNNGRSKIPERTQKYKNLEALINERPKSVPAKSGKYQDLDIIVKMPYKSRSPYNVHYTRGTHSGFKNYGTSPLKTFPYNKYGYRQTGYQHFGPPKAKSVIPRKVPLRDSFGGPKILDFPGGTPTHIEKLNRLNYGKGRSVPSLTGGSSIKTDSQTRGANTNLESQKQQKAIYRVRPLNTEHPKPLSGWIIKRLQR